MAAEDQSSQAAHAPEDRAGQLKTGNQAPPHSGSWTAGVLGLRLIRAEGTGCLHVVVGRNTAQTAYVYLQQTEANRRNNYPTGHHSCTKPTLGHYSIRFRGYLLTGLNDGSSRTTCPKGVKWCKAASTAAGFHTTAGTITAYLRRPDALRLPRHK